MPPAVHLWGEAAARLGLAGYCHPSRPAHSATIAARMTAWVTIKRLRHVKQHGRGLSRKPLKECVYDVQLPKSSKYLRAASSSSRCDLPSNLVLQNIHPCQPYQANLDTHHCTRASFYMVADSSLCLKQRTSTPNLFNRNLHTVARLPFA